MRPPTVHVLAIAALLTTAACSTGEDRVGPSETKTSDKPFKPGGFVSVELEGGNYEVRMADSDAIRVTMTGNVGGAHADITTDGTNATVSVKDTPNNHFTAVIDVPRPDDLRVRLSGGNLRVAAFAGNKDIRSGAGNVDIAAGDPADYAQVDATVMAGEIKADAFGEHKSGLNPHFTWNGNGTHTLRANLGAGDLTIAR